MNATEYAIRCVKAQGLRDAAAHTYTHTTIGQDGKRTQSDRFTLSAEVREWLILRAEELEARA